MTDNKFDFEGDQVNETKTQVDISDNTSGAGGGGNGGRVVIVSNISLTQRFASRYLSPSKSVF